MKQRTYLPETKMVLEGLERDLRDPWERSQVPSDKLIWHYTDQGGLTAILESGKVRASNAFYLNDAMEVKYTQGLVFEEVDKKRRLHMDPVLREFLEHVEAGAQIAQLVFQPCVACFSGEKAGDLLSQWQAYGNGGAGYALGFDPQDMGTDPSGSQLRKVIYDEATQRRLIGEAIDRYCTALPGVVPSLGGRTGLIPEAVSDFSHSIDKILHEYLYCFKHPSWAAEEEWRLVSRVVPFRTAAGVLDAGGLKFRGSKVGVPTPYVELDIRREDPNDLVKRMPLKQIIVGPKIPFTLAENSLKQLLQLHEYEGVNIVKSKSTLV